MASTTGLRLSVAIIAKDEEENLRRTLPAVARLAAEIVVVDSGSTDATVQVAESFGARVVKQNWLGFGPQKNLAIAECREEWVLSLDADEQLSDVLCQAIAAALPASSPGIAGFTLARSNLFLGRPMRHGGMYPDRKLRLFRRGQARFQDRLVHESMEPTAPGGKVLPLQGDLIHNAYPSLALYLEHMNRYSSAGGSLLHGKVSRSSAGFLWNVVVNPAATFVYNYVVRGGFLDGREGLLLHLYHSVYVSLKYAKAWEQAHTQTR